MPVTDVTQDIDALTLTIVADFAAPVQRIWEVYADPRQLEKVFGPPTYPATMVDPDLPVSRNTYSFASTDGGTRATYVSTYASAEALQQVLDMGVVEGASSAIDQIDDLLTAG